MNICTIPNLSFGATHSSNMSNSSDDNESVNNPVVDPDNENNPDVDPDDEPAPARNVCARLVNGYGLIPQVNNVVFPAGLVEVDIEHMMSDNPERQKGIMYLQLIRVVSGSITGSDKMSQYQSYFKKTIRRRDP